MFHVKTILMDLFLTNTQLFTSQDVNWWTGVVWIIVRFLSAVWTLILTAPIHYRGSIVGKWCNAKFLLFWWRNKLIYIWGRVNFQFCNFYLQAAFRFSDPPLWPVRQQNRCFLLQVSQVRSSFWTFYQGSWTPHLHWALGLFWVVLHLLRLSVFAQGSFPHAQVRWLYCCLPPLFLVVLVHLWQALAGFHYFAPLLLFTCLWTKK